MRPAPILIDRLGARKAAFHFVERFGGELRTTGPRELLAKAARWLKPSGWDATLPDLLPVWEGSYLPHSDAARRFVIPEVWTVVIGCRDAAQRRGLVKEIRRAPPLGMFELEAAPAWPPERASLPLRGFVAPDAAITFAARRHVDRLTGLDVIGIAEEESEMLRMAAEWGTVTDGDLLSGQLATTLAKRVGRSMSSPGLSDGYTELVDQSFELYGLGADSLAGAIAGVAFERLMRAALDAPGRAWATAREAQNQEVKLNDVIGKVASAGRYDNGRLHRYRRLRNDFAHRLGDDDTRQRSADDLHTELGRFLRWLDRQTIDDHGHAALAAVDPSPELDNQQLYDTALAAGEVAAAAITPYLIRVQDDEFEPFGSAWVIVPDQKLAFNRWLIDQGHAQPDERGARLHAPYPTLERGLAWAQACAAELRWHEVDAYDAGVPT